MYDVVVLGAGLAGLAAARDLVAGGADVLVLEARARVGGRVEQVTLEDGRLVQLGGEVIGNSHTAYQQLVAELGLTLVPSYVAEPGELTFVLHDGIHVGDSPSWFAPGDHHSMRRVEDEFAAPRSIGRPRRSLGTPRRAPPGPDVGAPVAAVGRRDP